MKRIVIWVAVLVALAIPGVALAQSALAAEESVLVAVDRDVVIAAGDSVGTLVVVAGNATVSGRVHTVVVVDGTLTVDGSVEETIVAVESDVVLAATAVVHGDVVMPSGELTREPGAVVDGSVHRNFDFQIGWALTIFSILFWIGITIGLVLAGFVLVSVARRQVQGTGNLLTGTPGATILATVLLVIVLPVAAFFAFISVVGIPIGLALLVVGVPLLWTAGYLVAGERVGRAVLGANRAGGDQVSPYLSVLLGVLIFQIVGLVPVLGAFTIVIAATYGAGGIALYAFQAWRAPTLTVPSETVAV